MSEEGFEPRLGKIRSPRFKRSGRYLRQCIVAGARAGSPIKGRQGRFDGSRIGRGSGNGRLLRSTGRLEAQRGRRAVVKTRLVRLSKGAGGALAHLKYLQRDGVQRDGSPGVVYSATADVAVGKSFIEQGSADRHQFRLIVSAEDGAQYDDLKPLVRRFMAELEKDLGTRLDWVAVDHTDTQHPHSHVILRGRDDQGNNLVISREYISHGMRERLCKLVTRDLGPRQAFEVQRSLGQEVEAERLTSIDRSLIRESGIDCSVDPSHTDPMRHAIRMGRLRKLEALGFAEQLVSGRWRLAEGLEDRLRRLGERGDIIRTMQRQLSAAGVERAASDLVHRSHLGSDGLTGRILARGLADEARDRHYLLIDAVDGRIHYADIGSGSATEPFPDGAIVRLSPAPAAPSQADERIARIAAANGGFYSPEVHRAEEPGASDEYIRAHERRLESLRRGGLAVERLTDSSWLISADHLERVQSYAQARQRTVPVQVALLSPLPLERLPASQGATWLDRQIGGDDIPLRDSGFGREVRSALAQRRQWLIKQQLADERSGECVLRPHALRTLSGREIAHAGDRLSTQLGKHHVTPAEGDVVRGVLTRRVDLASGRFALVENGREFSLVPWRAVLQRRIGQEVEAVVRGEGVNWSFGRSRSGPAIA